MLLPELSTRKQNTGEAILVLDFLNS